MMKWNCGRLSILWDNCLLFEPNAPTNNSCVNFHHLKKQKQKKSNMNIKWSKSKSILKPFLAHSFWLVLVVSCFCVKSPNQLCHMYKTRYRWLVLVCILSAESWITLYWIFRKHDEAGTFSLFQCSLCKWVSDIVMHCMCEFLFISVVGSSVFWFLLWVVVLPSQ